MSNKAAKEACFAAFYKYIMRTLIKSDKLCEVCLKHCDYSNKEEDCMQEKNKLIAIGVLSLISFFVLIGCTARNSMSSQYIYEPLRQREVIMTSGIGLTENNFYLPAPYPADVVTMDTAGVIFKSAPEITFTTERLIITRINRVGGWSAPELYVLNNAFIGWSTVAICDYGNIYVPVISLSNNMETQKIVRLCSSIPQIIPGVDTSRTEVIIREMEQVTYINFFVEGNYLIIFEPKFNYNEFIYKISKLDLTNNAESLLINESFSMVTNSGYVISNMYVQNGSIFLYRVKTSNGGVRDFFIDEYDLFGNLVNTYVLDILEFLHMYEVMEEDSVIRLYKYDDYFVLQTIHNRIGIFRLEGERIIEIDIPDSLQRLGAATIVSSSESGSDSIYFWDNIYDVLYIYDLYSKTFIRVPVYVERDGDFALFLEDWIHSVHRNSEGTVLFQARIDFDAYLRWVENERTENEAIGDMFHEGAAGYMPGDSIFFVISANEMRDFINLHIIQ